MGTDMTRRIVSGLAVAAFILAPSAAFAGHGKAGLWNITATTDMAMTGMKMPGAQSHISQMCMSQEEVDTDAPPHIDQMATGCTTHVTSATSSSMTAKMVCSGNLKGDGHMQIVYRSAEHYAGTYSFKGAVEGNPSTMTTSFKGDWVKADCGDVRAYKLRTQ